ncbi:MAG: HAD hydrolase-like protein, partial [Actinobacteria bacterium]|nr:HAD hydrolase-like protein [Actinomycetota bacterium]
MTSAGSDATNHADVDDPSTVEAVVFDLGGVLVDWDPRYVLAADEVVALDIDGVQRQLDLGVPVAQVQAAWRRAYPDRTQRIDRYFDRWHDTVAGPLAATVEVLDDLRARPVQLYALSNFSSELFRQVRHRFDFVEWFDGLVISGDEGVIKPDPQIYRLLIDRYDLRPSSTV